MPHDVCVTSTTPQPTGRKNARLGQTVGDMVRSLAVVLAVVGILVVVTYQSQKSDGRVVDVSTAQAQAQRQASYPLLLPDLGDSYQATSVRWEPTAASGTDPVWHVGYLANGSDYLQVSQSSTVAAGFVPEQTAGGEPAGESSIAGARWQRYEQEKRRSLVKVDGGVTTTVSGTADWATLAGVAASLAAR